mmetsp:Transcript_15864/g.18434  ORF Transcript_15864/g.18434 Transcript_15864/m.18434 type:complete len:204 (+) Transcript_15864:470-1081(+)
MSKACCWDSIMIYNMFPTSNVFNGRNSLCRGCMCQHHFTVGITNTPKVGYNFSIFSLGQNLHFFVNSNKTTVSFDAHFFKSHILGGRYTSSGNHCCINFKSFNMFLGLGINHLDCYRLYTRNTRCNLTCEYTSPVINCSIPNQKSLCQFGNFFIKGWHDVIHSFNESNFGSKCSVNIREFKTNVSRTNNGYPLRNRIKFKCSI